MKALQAMFRASPGDADAQLANVAGAVLVIEGSLDPDWADPRAESEKIIARLPAGPVNWPSSAAPATTCRPRLPARSSRWPCPSSPGRWPVPRAGLTPAAVTAAGAALADEIGFASLAWDCSPNVSG